MRLSDGGARGKLRAARRGGRGRGGPAPRAERWGSSGGVRQEPTPAILVMARTDDRTRRKTSASPTPHSTVSLRIPPVCGLSAIVRDRTPASPRATGRRRSELLTWGGGRRRGWSARSSGALPAPAAPASAAVASPSGAQPHAGRHRSTRT
ncbi:hypothetical protein LP52_24210 [Streptomonospora alba]|uniref:Uncharacterized protein n=1 Tax=Streptomonospora alba TaxID=183763 RepID=A0A0C2JC77_9ACTN|nr:hypothetical protein LP52_24210 [Streptomonospora alba]